MATKHNNKNIQNGPKQLVEKLDLNSFPEDDHNFGGDGVYVCVMCV